MKELMYKSTSKKQSIHPDRYALQYRLSCFIVASMFTAAFVCLNANQASASSTKMMLSKAIASNLVLITGKANANGYHEKGLTLSIENKSKNALEITIDPALLFRPADTSYQDLVIAGNITTMIEPGKSRNIDLQSYCGKSNAMAPLQQSAFRYWKQADSNMIKLLSFIRKNGIDNDIAQSAVWVLTNKHELSTVYHEDEDASSRKLIAYMASLLGKELPKYYKQYNINTTPGQPVFSRKTLKIFATFQWQLDSPKSLTMAVYNEKGEQVDKMFEQKMFQPGGYELTAKFESFQVEAGDYYIRLLSGGRMLKETKVKVE